MSDKLDILKETGAFLEGHFLLSSGRHSNAYCQMAKLQQYPDTVSYTHLDVYKRQVSAHRKCTTDASSSFSAG